MPQLRSRTVDRVPDTVGSAIIMSDILTKMGEEHIKREAAADSRNKVPSGGPIRKPQTHVAPPDGTTEKSEADVAPSDGMTEKFEGSVPLPDETTEKSEAHVAPLDGTTEKSEAHLAPPDGTTEKSEANVAPPDGSRMKSEAHVARPDGSKEKSQTSIASPEVSDKKSAVMHNIKNSIVEKAPEKEDSQILLGLLSRPQLAKSEDVAVAAAVGGGEEEEVSKVIENVDRSGSFLMKLLTDPSIQNKNMFSTTKDGKHDAKQDESEKASKHESRDKVECEAGGEVQHKKRGEGGQNASTWGESMFSMDGGNVIVIEPQPETITMNLASRDHECTICDESFSAGEELTVQMLSSHVLENITPDRSGSFKIKTRKRTLEATNESFAPKILCVSGNAPFQSENHSETATKRDATTRSKESFVESAEDDPSIGFVQGYLCKECGFLRKSLEDLKKHVQKEHSQSSVKEKMVDVQNLGKLLAKAKPVPEPPQCLICGKSSGNFDSKKVKLENIFNLPGRFDRKLNGVLGADVIARSNSPEHVCTLCMKKVRKIDLAKKLEKELKEEYDNTKKERAQKQQRRNTESRQVQSKRKKKNTEVRKVTVQKDMVDSRGGHESGDEVDMPAPIMVCLPGSDEPQMLCPKLVTTPGSEQGTYVYMASEDTQRSGSDQELWKKVEQEVKAPVKEGDNDSDHDLWKKVEQQVKSEDLQVPGSRVHTGHSQEPEVQDKEQTGRSGTCSKLAVTSQPPSTSSSALRSLLGSPSNPVNPGKSTGTPLFQTSMIQNGTVASEHSSTPVKTEKSESNSSSKSLQKLREMIQAKLGVGAEQTRSPGRLARVAKQKCRQSFSNLAEGSTSTTEEEEEEAEEEDHDGSYIHKTPLKKRLYKPPERNRSSLATNWQSPNLKGLFTTGRDSPDNQSNLRNLLGAVGVSTVRDKMAAEKTAGELMLKELGQVVVKSEQIDDSYINQFLPQNLPDGMGLQKPGGIDPALKNRYMVIPARSSTENWLTGYRCTLCFNIFYSEDAIELHVKCHKTEQSPDLMCFMCGFSSDKLPTQWRIIRRHLETNHGIHPVTFSRCPCPVPGCMLLFRYQAERDQHLIKVHNRMGTKNKATHYLKPNGLFDYNCPLCGNSLQSLEALDIHVKCHNGNPKSYKCYLCDYSHPSQPGSWRFMRGHLSRDHMPRQIPNEWFNYFECSRYTCRIKFASGHAREIHESCHDTHKDGHFRCSMCGFRVTDTPFMWEPVRDHVIKYHPAVFDGPDRVFECACGFTLNSFQQFEDHMYEETNESFSKT